MRVINITAVLASMVFLGTVVSTPTREPTSIPTSVPSLSPSPMPSPAPTGALLAEKSALEALYTSTGGSAWFSKAHWMDGSTHVSKWYGVTCSGEDAADDDTDSSPLGTVKLLQLNNNNLVGTLPSEIAALVHVEKLGMRENSLSRSLPTELGLMTNAHEFELSQNTLSSSCPSELGLIRSMKDINLHKNFLSKSLPTELGSLTELTAFELGNNTLSSSCPSELGLIRVVQNFLLHDNAISKSIPSELGLLTNTKQLSLFNNSIASSLPTELGLMSLAKFMIFNSNLLTSVVPTQLGRLRRARLLSMYHNSLEGGVPTELGRLESGELLFLDANSLTNSIPTQLGLLHRNLSAIGLENNSCWGTIPSQLSLLTKIESFDIRGNSFSGSLPSQMALMSSVKAFGVGSNLFTSFVPTELGLLGTDDDEFFDLRNNFFNRTIPTEFGKLSQVQAFALDRNAFTGTIPTQIGQLSAAQFFDLKENKLIGQIPSQIGNFDVRSIILMSNSLNGTLPTEIGHLDKLQTFASAYNSLSGTIPTEFGTIGHPFQVLAINDNRLETAKHSLSAFPPEVCNLTGLQIVSLANNDFSGLLPNAGKAQCPLGFSDLQVFNAAGNRFTGGLPSLKTLVNIRYLLLHENGLSGSLDALDFELSEHQGPVYYGATNIKALTLHSNSISGRIPQDLALPRSMETLTFANNKLFGRIPNNLLKLQHLENTSMTMFGTNNRLSCRLPNWNFTTTPQSLFLIGNAFSWFPPKWIQDTERTATFLTTVVRTRYRRFPLWQQLLSQAGVVIIITLPLLAWYRRDINNNYMYDELTDDFEKRVCSDLYKFSWWVLVLAGASLPIFLVLFGFGAKFYECGDAFMKYATSAYLADSAAVAWLLACFSVIWTAILSLLLTQWLAAVEDDSFQDNLNRENSRSVRSKIETTCDFLKFCRMRARGGLCLVCWFVGLLFVGGLPSIVYVATYSAPKRNDFGFHNWEVETLAHVLALYLSCVSWAIIPWATRLMVGVLLEEGSSKRRYQEWESVLGVLIRTFVVIIVPVASVVLFDNGCFKKWTLMWKPCSEDITFLKILKRIFRGEKLSSHGFFTRTIAVPFEVVWKVPIYEHIDGKRLLRTLDVPVGGKTALNFMSDKAVCDAPYEAGRCSRGILQTLCPLFAYKLMYIVLISVLVPVIDAKCRPFVAPIYETGRQWLQQKVQQLRLRCGRSCQGNKQQQEPKQMKREEEEEDANALDMDETPEDEEVHAHDTKKNERAEEEEEDGTIDPGIALIWYETAFIFGCLSPLLMVLAGAQLFADATAFEWKLKRSKQDHIKTLKPLPILPRVLRAHLMLVLCLQAAMLIFFFFDTQSDNHSAILVAVAESLIVCAVFCNEIWRRYMGRRWALQTARETELIQMPTGRTRKATIEEQKAVSGRSWGSSMGDVFLSPFHPWGGEYEGEDGRGYETNSEVVRGSTNSEVEAGLERTTTPVDASSPMVNPMITDAEVGEGTHESEEEEDADVKVGTTSTSDLRHTNEELPAGLGRGSGEGD